MIVGEARKPTLEWRAPARSFTRAGSDLAHNHYTRLAILGRNKLSSLLRKSVNYGQKKFYNIGPRPQNNFVVTSFLLEKHHFPSCTAAVLLEQCRASKESTARTFNQLSRIVVTSTGRVTRRLKKSPNAAKTVAKISKIKLKIHNIYSMLK